MLFDLRRKKASVLVLGADGMLGTELFELLKKESVRSGSGVGFVYGMTRRDLDSAALGRHGIGEFFRTSRRFDVCVNCVAMTDTKAAETTPAGADLSYRLNALFPKHVAESCAYWKVRLVHISTDYVFSRSRPFPSLDDAFSVNDVPYPANVYGMHKLLGEQFVKNEFTAAGRGGDYAVLRTSWLYGMANSKSFVHRTVATAVKAVEAGRKLDMTLNEWSVPTPVGYLSRLITDSFITEWTRGGVFHAVPDGKPVSRAEWAEAILAGLGQVPAETADTVFPVITSPGFVNPVERAGLLNPEYSALVPTVFPASGPVAHEELLRSFMLENGAVIYAACGKTQ